MAIVFVGIGSNIGHCRENLHKACEEIKKNNIKILKHSSIEETLPADYKFQPKFLNTIIQIETDIEPGILLDLFKNIEKKMGRKKNIPKGPRIIDLDILLYDDLILNTVDLIIPHPQIKKRPFILKHLIEIDRDLADPLTGEKYSVIYQR